jgi:hypothetical protein
LKRSTRRITSLATGSLAAGCLILAACTPVHTQGTAGTVIGRSSSSACRVTGSGRHLHLSHCGTHYALITQSTHGKKQKFDAPYSAYDHCTTGSAYPRCITK